jgi:eukaryotic-like serine/threonine-protein kinase
MPQSADLEEFRLVRLLGRGGMGEVYLGHDTILDRAVAIKVIRAATADAASRERFLTEARAIARLSHPNVVTIYRVGTTHAGRPFLVQELIRGASLDQLPRPVGWRKVCELAIGIARGLEAAHRRGIVHRDVKPANVMIDEHGTARLLDFGLAKLSALAESSAAWAGPEADQAARPGAPPSGSRTDSSVAETSDPVAETSDPVAETRDPVAETRDPVAVRADLPEPAPGIANLSATAGGATLTPAGGASSRPRQSTGLVSLPSAATAAELAEPTAVGSDPASGSAALAGDAAATPPGRVVGTPRYAAPEIWRGEPASVRSDLYSLGAMLYELLAGAAPYPQTQPGELRAAALAGAARPIDELVPEVDPRLARLVMACLAPEPAGRPGSVAAIAHELEAMIVGAPAIPAGNPYRGLRAFDAAHRGLFFGRGADVDALVDRLRGEPLVVVVGDSGIGKSSVCHAGVVPVVLTGGLGDPRRWRVVSLAPGRTPWIALCDALGLDPAIAVPADELVRRLRPDRSAGILIAIDQLEELVTLSAPAEAVRVAEVIAAIAGGVPGVKALVAVRGDFLTRVAALPELGAPMTRGLHLLRVLSAADLREAVVGPARASGVRYETEAMVNELVDAVADNPGALPLLQFTLAELWCARDTAGGRLPARALDQLGGVAGGLARHADAVMFALGAGERSAARGIVLRLVTAGRTRAVCEADELTGGAPVAAAALESLVRGRIVVARDTMAGTPSYELAHEALIHSWGTLGDWLDDAAGQHAARNRLQASAAEWQRLDRRDDLVWTRRQLDELRALDGLTAVERAFVAASRRRERRRRLARVAAIAAVPLVALAIFGGVRFEAARARGAAVAARLATAKLHHAAASQLAERAAAMRTAAFAGFDADDRVSGEAWWVEARRLGGEAHARYGDATAELEAAFVIDASAVRPQMAAVLWAQAELAEVERRPELGAELLRRLAAYDPERAARWSQPGHVVLELDRPARVTVHAFGPGTAGRKLAGGFDARPVAERSGARIDVELRPGSYLSVIAMPDGLAVHDPFVLGRGERYERAIVVPTRASIPAGFLYVPAGRFLYGASGDEVMRRDQLGAQPLHTVHGAGFAIARHEVTYGDWLGFLRALPREERVARSPAGIGVNLIEQDGRFALTLKPATGQVHRAQEGALLRYPGRKSRSNVRWEQLPVSGISSVDALAYTRWLDRTGRVPRARLCSLREWERAARGADGRSFPHGEVLGPSDASFDETYGRNPASYGPDEVGSFPASHSPFGVADMVGNVWEWTVDSKGGYWFRGGSFYQGAISALSNNANRPADPSQRDVKIGLRVCADLARAR